MLKCGDPLPSASCTGIETDVEPIPTRFEFNVTVYPNPFMGTATISFTLERATKVERTVCNVGGQKVQTLVSGQLAPGEHSRVFESQELPSGLYFYRLTSEAGTSSGGLVIAKAKAGN